MTLERSCARRMSSGSGCGSWPAAAPLSQSSGTRIDLPSAFSTVSGTSASLNSGSLSRSRAAMTFSATPRERNTSTWLSTASWSGRASVRTAWMLTTCCWAVSSITSVVAL